MNMQKFRRTLASVASLVVGGASFALSFVALRDVAAAYDAVPANLAWLVPIVIDGGVICGSAIIWSASYEQSRRPFFPFAFTGVLVIISVVVNAAHAGPSPLAKLIAALPPLILLGTLELVAAQGRHAHEAVRTAANQQTADQQRADQQAAEQQAAIRQAAELLATEMLAEKLAAEDTPTALSDGSPQSPARARQPRPRTQSSSPRRTTSAAVPAVVPSDSVPPVADALTGRRPLRVAAQPAEIVS
jgi:hypothetical protein